jgi:hypothetical protein
MTESRSKSEVLSETAKTYIQDVFKEKELGEEWWYYQIIKPHGQHNFTLVPYIGNEGEYAEVNLVKLTPRKLLQLIGTECFRNIIHPNSWVNSLMSEYKSERCEDYGNCLCGSGVFADGSKGLAMCEAMKPKWIITDMRFPNEYQAIKDRKGITIKVNRTKFHTTDAGVFGTITLMDIPEKEHESEVALDHITDWDYIVDNNSTIDDLVMKVKEILIKEQIIK